MRLTKDEFVEAINTYDEMLKQNNAVADAMRTKELYSDAFVDNYYAMLIQMCDIPDKSFDKRYGCDIDFFTGMLDFGRGIESFINTHAIQRELLKDFESAETLYEKLLRNEEGYKE